MSLIAIDYDGTYTADPQSWELVVKLLQLRHEVICVTMRYESESVEFRPPCMVYYTERKAKLYWCRANGLKPDIWIDDNPHWIIQDSA